MKGNLENINEKGEHDKVKHIIHSKVEMQDFLSLNSLTNEESKFIFLLRSRMLFIYFLFLKDFWARAVVGSVHQSILVFIFPVLVAGLKRFPNKFSSLSQAG